MANHSAEIPDRAKTDDAAIAGQLLALRNRFGDRLSPGEWESVRAALAKQRARADRLRGVRLANGDEPATTFSAGMLDG